jgi:hypothetical protein
MIWPGGLPHLSGSILFCWMKRSSWAPERLEHLNQNRFRTLCWNRVYVNTVDFGVTSAMRPHAFCSVLSSYSDFFDLGLTDLPRVHLLVLSLLGSFLTGIPVACTDVPSHFRALDLQLGQNFKLSTAYHGHDKDLARTWRSWQNKPLGLDHLRTRQNWNKPRDFRPPASRSNGRVKSSQFLLFHRIIPPNSHHVPLLSLLTTVHSPSALHHPSSSRSQ